MDRFASPLIFFWILFFNISRYVDRFWVWRLLRSSIDRTKWFLRWSQFSSSLRWSRHILNVPYSLRYELAERREKIFQQEQNNANKEEEDPNDGLNTCCCVYHTQGARFCEEWIQLRMTEFSSYMKGSLYQMLNRNILIVEHPYSLSLANKDF